MRRILALSKSIFLINLRNRTTLFWNFAFPIGLLLLYSLIFAEQRSGPVDAIAWLTVGVAVLNIMSTGFMGDAAWLTNMRDQGILLRMQAAPLPTWTLVGAYSLVRLALVLLQAAAIVAVAMLGLGASFSWGGLAGALAVGALGAAVFIALGQAIAAVAPSSGAALAIGQTLYFPLMFISNLFLPSEQLPAWLEAASRWTPAFMLVDLTRPLLVAIPAVQAAWLNILGLALYGAAGLALAARFFSWEPRR